MGGAFAGRAISALAVALAVLVAVLVLVAVSQVAARVVWRARTRARGGRGPRWTGHVDAAQAEALWGTRPPAVVAWFWRGLYPAALRARPDGLLLTARGTLFTALAGQPHTVIRWPDLLRARVRPVPRFGPEHGLSVVRLTRVSLLLGGAAAARVGADPVTGTAHLRFITPAPEGLGALVNREPSRESPATGPTSHRSGR